MQRPVLGGLRIPPPVRCWPPTSGVRARLRELLLMGYQPTGRCGVRIGTDRRCVKRRARTVEAEMSNAGRNLTVVSLRYRRSGASDGSPGIARRGVAGVHVWIGRWVGGLACEQVKPPGVAGGRYGVECSVPIARSVVVVMNDDSPYTSTVPVNPDSRNSLSDAAERDVVPDNTEVVGGRDQARPTIAVLV